jgi:hypothetical protein
VETTRTRPPEDTKVDTKVVLSGLWISTLFVFAYVDIFGFWRADIINGALDGEVPRLGFEIGQTFLALTTLYILIPSLMVVISLVVNAGVNRVVNLVVSAIYVVTIGLSLVGEAWIYYNEGSIVEIVHLLAVARVAWTW